MIRYTISYEHTAGSNSFYVESVKELINALERLDDDPHVVQGSINVQTTKLYTTEQSALRRAADVFDSAPDLKRVSDKRHL